MRCARPTLGLALGLGLLAPARAWADQLDTPTVPGEAGFSAIEELSYEAIVEPSDVTRGDPHMRLRIALHNSSVSPRDAVHSVALPRGAELIDLAIAKDGQWHPSVATSVVDDGRERGRGTVWARTLAPDSNRALPMAQIVAYGLEPEETIQIELNLRIAPTFRAGRWELELPNRGSALDHLARDRRVLVRTSGPTPQFEVDGITNAGAPMMLTHPADSVLVSWPGTMASTATIDGRYEILPGPEGFDDGQFRLTLRAGQVPGPRPDHVLLVIDRSRSTSTQLASGARTLGTGLMDTLPARTTFDAIAFARTSSPLVPDRPWFRAADQQARAALDRALDGPNDAQGTDLGAALDLAGKRLRQRGARRPLLVVVTDGMLPTTTQGSDLRTRLQQALAGVSTPEVLFIVDDPLFERRGLPADHPIAQVAAQLGARISLTTLSQLDVRDLAALRASPQVLGDLHITVPKHLTLQTEPPTGLVAGNVTVLTGRYQGSPPPRITVTARRGTRPVRRILRARRSAPPAQAFASSILGAVDPLASVGFTLPGWLDVDRQQTARASVARAGRRREWVGHLDDALVGRYLGVRVLPRVRVCYNHALTRNLDQAGRILLDLEIGKGEVMAAHASADHLTHPDPQLIACATEAAWALQIPAGQLDERRYVIRYPLRLIHPEEPLATGAIEATDTQDP